MHTSSKYFCAYQDALLEVNTFKENFKSKNFLNYVVRVQKN